jgi:hypothetical protein
MTYIPYSDNYNILPSWSSPPRPVYTQNKKVAVEPFKKTAVETSARGAGTVKVARIENKVELVALKVVFPTEDNRFRVGMSVLVRGDLFVQIWAKEKHVIDGQEFILLPETAVEMVLDPPPAVTGTSASVQGISFIGGSGTGEKP